MKRCYTTFAATLLYAHIVVRTLSAVESTQSFGWKWFLPSRKSRQRNKKLLCVLNHNRDEFSIKIIARSTKNSIEPNKSVENVACSSLKDLTIDNVSQSVMQTLQDIFLTQCVVKWTMSLPWSGLGCKRQF